MADCFGYLADDQLSKRLDEVACLVKELHLTMREMDERGIKLILNMNRENNQNGGITMQQVDVVLAGADKLSEQLDKVEDLVLKLRRALADLDERRMYLEMRLNPDETQEKI